MRNWSDGLTLSMRTPSGPWGLFLQQRFHLLHDFRGHRGKFASQGFDFLSGHQIWLQSFLFGLSYHIGIGHHFDESLTQDLEPVRRHAGRTKEWPTHLIGKHKYLSQPPVNIAGFVLIHKLPHRGNFGKIRMPLLSALSEHAHKAGLGPGAAGLAAKIGLDGSTPALN